MGIVNFSKMQRSGKLFSRVFLRSSVWSGGYRVHAASTFQSNGLQSNASLFSHDSAFGSSLLDDQVQSTILVENNHGNAGNLPEESSVGLLRRFFSWVAQLVESFLARLLQVRTLLPAQTQPFSSAVQLQRNGHRTISS